ncbi:MAG TPA: hypothetical protein PKN57_08370 [Saprospiraceae bacterium]|nr:hypothetical protein [Saprospiraceae bacterium]
MRNKATASTKSKELQLTAQSQRFAAHLLLPQPHHQHSTDTFTENRNFLPKHISIFTK